jgi:hypothetical protein
MGRQRARKGRTTKSGQGQSTPYASQGKRKRRRKIGRGRGGHERSKSAFALLACTDGSHSPTYLSSSCSRNLPKDRLAHHHPVPLVIYPRPVSNHQGSLSFLPRPLAKRLQHHTTSVHVACRQRQMAHLVVRDNYLLRVEKPAMAYRKPWRSRNKACMVIRVRTVMRHSDT